MNLDITTFAGANRAQFDGQKSGHYESWFMRANHATRPLAFWIRYTIFSPRGRSQDAIGELWAIWFDGETHKHTAVKKELPMAECRFDRENFDVVVGEATLNGKGLRGAAEANGNRIGWHLQYSGGEPPLRLLSAPLYKAKLPKAKALVCMPNAHYTGTIELEGETHAIDNWIGSQNHNWGSKHTDYYAWGQVAGFDDAPDVFLELATGKLRFGPIWTPFMTPVALRYGGKEYHMDTIRDGFRARAGFELFDWHFAMENHEIKLAGRIHVNKQDVVGLRYYNPPGGAKSCLNSKIAACELHITLKTGANAGRETVLHSAHRAAFEILTDAPDHGINIQV